MFRIIYIGSPAIDDHKSLTMLPVPKILIIFEFSSWWKIVNELYQGFH
jgi:hypothetical protein